MSATCISNSDAQLVRPRLEAVGEGGSPHRAQIGFRLNQSAAWPAV